jgi:hypothetical protein
MLTLRIKGEARSYDDDPSALRDLPIGKQPRA